MFAKGQSGNPSGRPKKSEEQKRFERRCREYADTLGFDKLRRWADSEDGGKSLAALQEIFNRGFGKSVEIIDAEVTSNAGPSVADLEREAADLLGRREGESGGVDGAGPVGQ